MLDFAPGIQGQKKGCFKGYSSLIFQYSRREEIFLKLDDFGGCKLF